MSRTTVSCQSLAEGGSVVTFATADNSNGNDYVNTGVESVIVKNASGSSRTVTSKTQKASTQIPGMGTLNRADIVLTLADGEEGVIPPLPQAIFNTSSGKTQLDISGTGVSIAVVKPA